MTQDNYKVWGDEGTTHLAEPIVSSSNITTTK